MTHQIVLDIPDDVYVPLARCSQEAGKPLEAFAADCLAEVVRPRAPTDRLLRWGGVIDSGVPDAAERHDYYIGKALAEGLKAPTDE